MLLVQKIHLVVCKHVQLATNQQEDGLQSVLLYPTKTSCI